MLCSVTPCSGSLGCARGSGSVSVSAGRLSSLGVGMRPSLSLPRVYVAPRWFSGNRMDATVPPPSRGRRSSVPPVSLNDRIADAQAEPGALSDGFRGEERVEDTLAQVFGDAVTGIGDDDHVAVGVGPAGDRDGPF